jgi:hypothetical protein
VWIRCLLAVLCALTFGAPARGQATEPPPTTATGTQQSAPPRRTNDSQRQASKVHFERGLALAKTGQHWDAALAEFLASRELYATRSATRNAAVALRQLGRAAESLDYYLMLLHEFADSIPADELVAVQSEMTALRPLVGELDVRATQAGTRVVVDGRQRGTTPLAGVLRIDAGTHTLRFSKEGFETIELALTIAGGQRRVLKSELRRLRASGTLVVREASGASLDVVLDSAVVGKTPWSGSVAPGIHAVFLLGERGLGTAPSAAEVKLDQATSLTLRAVPLSAAIVVEPAPSNAVVYIDGVSVGNGVWQGSLPAGTHRIEVTAPGHLSFRRDTWLAAEKREIVRARLERDLGFRPHPYAEIVVGGVAASSFHGGADNACSCSERSRPLGGLAAARIGYTVVGGLGIELNGGYLSMSGRMTRQLKAGRENSWRATDYEDATTLRGSFIAVTGSYRLLEKTPVTARLGLGLAVLTSATSNNATFTGELTNPEQPAETQTYTSRVSIQEMERRLLVPFASTEIRFGYRVSKRFSVDLGVGLWLLLPPREPRVGANNLSDDRNRATLLDPGAAVWADGRRIAPGVIELPDEAIAGPFLAVSPTLGARVDF